MKRRLAALAAVILLPAGASRPWPYRRSRPPARTSARDRASAASPEMLAAMQRDLGLTADQAKVRIASDDAASRTDADAAQEPRRGVRRRAG